MKWCEAYIQMKKNNAFVRRKVWGERYLVWLKPVFMIQEDWCKDENLKALISKYGDVNNKGKKVLKEKECFSLFNAFSIETGWQPRPEDMVVDDWEVVVIK